MLVCLHDSGALCSCLLCWLTQRLKIPTWPVLGMRLSLPPAPPHDPLPIPPEPATLPWHPSVRLECSSISSSPVETGRWWGWTPLSQGLRLSRASCQAQQRMRCKTPRVWVWFSPWSWFSAGPSLHKNLEEKHLSPTMVAERSFRNTWRSATASLSPSSFGCIHILC